MTIAAREAGPVRVGLIGYGLSGRVFHAPIIRATPGLVLAAVASRDAARVLADGDDVVVTADPMALIDLVDVDLVVVASPNHTHSAFARAALLAGKHVVVDKPFTVDLAQARELAAVTARSGRLLSVFQNRRWDSDYLGVAQAIREDLLGPVTHFESHMDRFRPDQQDRWRERPGPGAGLWFDLGPHLVDQSLQLFGLPDRLQANFAMQRPGARVEDWFDVLLDYGDRRVSLRASSLCTGGTNRFTVHGPKGSLVKREPDQQDVQIRAGMAPTSPDWGADPDPIVWWNGAGERAERRAPAGDHRRYYAAMRDTIHAKGDNPVPPIQAIAVMAVLDAAAQAARERRSVGVPLSLDEVASFERSRAGSMTPDRHPEKP